MIYEIRPEDSADIALHTNVTIDMRLNELDFSMGVWPIYRYCYQDRLCMRILCTAGTQKDTLWVENDFSPYCDYSQFINRICGHLIEEQH
jgi:hypothetical protein